MSQSLTAPRTPRSDRRRTAPAVRRRSVAPLLVLPALAFLAGVFFFPLFESVWWSVSRPEFGFDNYAWIFGSETNLAILGRTFFVAAAATVICLVLAYPYALLMVAAGPRVKMLLFILVLMPFWTSVTIRSFAWIILLQENGVVNAALAAVGLPGMQLLRSLPGVLIGLTQVLFPFMVLPIFAVLSGLDPRLLDAAKSLGARPAVAFLRIFVPLSLPGVAAGSLMVFIQALGFYVTPALLGSPSDSMVAQAIYAQVNALLEWGRGGALGAVLALVTLVIVAFVPALRGLGARFSQPSAGAVSS